MHAESKKSGTVHAEGGRGRSIIEAGLLYVGVPAVTLYPIGFIGLSIQLWRDPFFPYSDFTTIWQAVALIEHTVVVATGVRLIYLSMIATVLAMGVATLLLHLLGQAPDPADEHDSSEKRRRRRRGLWSLFWVILLPAGALLAWTTGRPDGWDDLLYLAGFILLSLVGGALIGYIKVQGRNDWFFSGLAIAYAGAILASLCLAALQTPALPVVEIGVEPGRSLSACPGGAAPSSDTYVKLEEDVNHWHLYDQGGLYAVPHEELHRVEYKYCPEFLDRN